MTAETKAVAHRQLVQILDRMDRKGWKTGGGSGPSGPACIMGHFYWRDGVTENERMTHNDQPYIMVLTEMLHGEPVWRFNDTHTEEEVRALLQTAIALTAPEPDVSFLDRTEERVA